MHTDPEEIGMLGFEAFHYVAVPVVSKRNYVQSIDLSGFFWLNAFSIDGAPADVVDDVIGMAVGLGWRRPRDIETVWGVAVDPYIQWSRWDCWHRHMYKHIL